MGGLSSKFISLNARCLEEQSLVHGGAALNCLSYTSYDALVKGVRNVDAFIDEIPDYDLRLSLAKLTDKASTVQEAVQTISVEKLIQSLTWLI